MSTLIVLYGVPTDAEAFDRHYRETHVPLAKNIPDLQSFSARRVVGTVDGSPPPYHLVVALTFADADTLGASLASEAGQAAANDVPNFATGGVQLLIAEDFA